MNRLKRTAKFSLVIFLLTSFASFVHGFNALRSRVLDGIRDVDNNLYNKEAFEIVDDAIVNNNTAICGAAGEPVDIDISRQFPVLNFNATWITRKYFWLSDDFNFESRFRYNYNHILATNKIVKVFILPHSHNDPGWLNTYEQYYYRQTKHILDNAVQKLRELPHMTFVWSEITYLAKWWKEASVLTREQFRQLVVDERRLEIATAGWVVPDEATPSLYTLLSELTEGQQWVKQHLDTTAKYSWAIDPFGYSATHSHLLKQAGMQGMVIQRLHYAWKHWLAEHKKGEFRWRPRWDDGNQEIPCLSLPFDLYSIKHACGPEPQVCLKFDFRSIKFEYGENFGLMTPITRSNIKQSAEEIVAQYHKTASLTNHNVILVPLGDDFRYDRGLEWEQQYGNYMQLFSYINRNQDIFGMEVQFGTLRDYFETVEQRERESIEKGGLSNSRPSLSGDFFPYSDVYVSGTPAYWTGFYGTRPYWKKFHRELENELRSAEILYTYANMLARKFNAVVETKMLSYKYQDLITARQDFSVFAHHDGITGTSRTWTMDDYGERLHAAYFKCIAVQQQSLKIIYQKSSPVRKSMTAVVLSKDFMRERFDWLPSKVPLELFRDEDGYSTKLMIFNNLGWNRTELVKVFVMRAVVVKVTDSKGQPVPSQINPVFTHDGSSNSVHLSERMYELVFLAQLEPLSTAVFKITKIVVDMKEEHGDFGGMAGGYSKMAGVSCDNCASVNDDNESHFTLRKIKQEDFILENSENRLHFQENGLLESIHVKKENTVLPVHLSYGMYRPTSKQSGAYLLKPLMYPEWKFFQQINSTKPHIIRISGPVMSQLISIHHDKYETIKVNTTLIHSIRMSPPISSTTGVQGVLLETYVDFSRDYSNRAEVYMRLDTGINSSTATAPSPKQNSTFSETVKQKNATKSLTDENLAMFTDQNGLVCEKRLTIPSLEYEGNTYPVTTMTYLQDEQRQLRFSVLVDRTHGFCSMKRGRLESLVERKSFYDDGRGMSEGVMDSRPTVSTYVLLVESLERGTKKTSTSEGFANWQPTLAAYKASFRQNYPPNLFVFNEPNEREDGGKKMVEEPTISLISSPVPEHVHLLSLRTLSAKDNETEVATTAALLNFQYLLDFESESRGEWQCKNTNGSNDKSRSGSTTKVVDQVDLMSEISYNNDGKKMKDSSGIIGFQMNYLNANLVVRTSLTGVEDEEESIASDNTVDLTEYRITSVGNGTAQSENQSSSLLINFKLYFG